MPAHLHSTSCVKTRAVICCWFMMNLVSLVLFGLLYLYLFSLLQILSIFTKDMCREVLWRLLNLFGLKYFLIYCRLRLNNTDKKKRVEYLMGCYYVLNFRSQSFVEFLTCAIHRIHSQGLHCNGCKLQCKMSKSKT